MPGIPGAVCLNAALIRLPARKGKKEEKNMCNLSQKEGSSLFAVLPERGRHCQRTFLFTQRRFFFLGGGWLCRLESNHIGLTRSLLTGEKNTQPCRWRWPRDRRNLPRCPPGGHCTGLWKPRGKPSTSGQCSMLLSPRGLSKFSWLDVAWRAFLSFKVKMNSIYPFASR